MDHRNIGAAHPERSLSSDISQLDDCSLPVRIRRQAEKNCGVAFNYGVTSVASLRYLPLTPMMLAALSSQSAITSRYFRIFEWRFDVTT